MYLKKKKRIFKISLPKFKNITDLEPFYTQ